LKIFAAVFGIFALFSSDVNIDASTRTSTGPDIRVEKLDAFFKSYRCPQPFHVDEYIEAADTYALDYRLLPAISVTESTCGWYERGNNRWGWNSARTKFESVTKGIRFLARKLALGRDYRGKSVKEKLQTYNPRPEYVRQVQSLMRQVDSDEAAARLMSEFRPPECATLDPDGSTADGDAPCVSDRPPLVPPRAWWRTPPCPSP